MKKILKIFAILLTPSSASLVTACGAPNGAKINAVWKAKNGTFNLFNDDKKINDTTNLTSGVIIPTIDFLNSTVESRQTNNNLTNQQISQTLQSQEKTLSAKKNWKNFYQDWNSNNDFSYSSIQLSYYTDPNLEQLGSVSKIKVVNVKAESKKDLYKQVYAPSFIKTITDRLNAKENENDNASIFKQGTKKSLIVNFSQKDLNKGKNFKFELTLTFVGAKNTYSFKILVKNLTLSFLLIDTKAKKKQPDKITNDDDDDGPEYQWFFIGYFYVPFPKSTTIADVSGYKPGTFFPHYLESINRAWQITDKYGLYFVNKNIIPQPSKKLPFQYLVYQLEPNSLIVQKNK